MSTLHDKIKKQVPLEMAVRMRQEVVSITGCSRATYYRYLMKGKDQRIGLAMAGYLGISLENLLDPSFSLVGIVKVSNQKEVV